MVRIFGGGSEIFLRPQGALDTGPLVKINTVRNTGVGAVLEAALV
jgi:hypothetical protein